jgi:hypothetical protein
MSHATDVTASALKGGQLADGEQPGLEPFELQQDAMGQWVLRLHDGTVHDRVVTVPEPQRTSVELALQGREFLPEILCLLGVSSFATPSVWRVKTSRGDTELVLKGEEDIRRLTANTLIVSDAHGVQYLIRHLAGMDRHSRKLLDRFL